MRAFSVQFRTRNSSSFLQTKTTTQKLRRGEWKRSFASTANPVQVKPFFEEATCTAQYVIFDQATNQAAIIDPVLDLEFHSGKLSTGSADQLLEFVKSSKLNVEWLLETHVHADHLTSAAYLKRELSRLQTTVPKIAISEKVTVVQQTLSKIFNMNIKTDGSQFDHLLKDNENLALGSLMIKNLYVPGHTPADNAFYIENDALFVGDTLCMPDSGTARCDFPGGSGDLMWESAHRLMSLPSHVRVFVCHDYKANNTRPSYLWETSIKDEIQNNIHVKDGLDKSEFLNFRKNRDAVLGLPRLFYPSLQFNLQAGAPTLDPVTNTFCFTIPTNYSNL
jgi:glyoxylase-like metal-dependent hydrolase (beta-lactamase superfamily II)